MVSDSAFYLGCSNEIYVTFKYSLFHAFWVDKHSDIYYTTVSENGIQKDTLDNTKIDHNVTRITDIDTTDSEVFITYLKEDSLIVIQIDENKTITKKCIALLSPEFINDIIMKKSIFTNVIDKRMLIVWSGFVDSIGNVSSNNYKAKGSFVDLTNVGINKIENNTMYNERFLLFTSNKNIFLKYSNITGKIKKIKIFSLNGKCVKDCKISIKQKFGVLNITKYVNSLSNGCYLLRINYGSDKTTKLLNLNF